MGFGGHRKTTLRVVRMGKTKSWSEREEIAVRLRNAGRNDGQKGGKDFDN